MLSLLSLLAHFLIFLCWVAASTGLSALLGKLFAILISPVGGAGGFWPFTVVLFIVLHVLLIHQVRSEVRIARSRC